MQNAQNVVETRMRMSPNAGDPPDPRQVKFLRIKKNLSLDEVCGILHCSRHQLWRWEGGRSPMPPAIWELYLLKTGEMPLEITDRSKNAPVWRTWE